MTAAGNWMDLQGGYAIDGREIERLAILEPDNDFQNIPSASLLWSSESLFSPKVLEALLERARRSTALELGELSYRFKNVCSVFWSLTAPA